MKFTVIGADAKSGQEVTISVSAMNRDEAEKSARAMGLLVSEVIAAEATTSPQTSPLRDAPKIADEPPKYGALHALGRLFRLCAFLNYALAILVAVILIVAAFSRNKGDPPIVGSVEEFFAVLIAAPCLVISGAILHGIGEFFFAFRDLVRNSFRT